MYFCSALQGATERWSWSTDVIMRAMMSPTIECLHIGGQGHMSSKMRMKQRLALSIG
jgi:hypothetical protein